MVFRKLKKITKNSADLKITALVILSIFVSSVAHAVDKKIVSATTHVADKKNLEKELSPIDFTIKYKVKAKSETDTIFISDTLGSAGRVDLDNDYYKISYNECIKAELLIEDTDDNGKPIPLTKSAGLAFVRTKECKSKNKYNFSDRMLVYHFSEARDLQSLKLYDKNLDSKYTIYRNIIRINGFKGSIETQLYYDGGRNSDLPFRVIIEILCEGKRNEIYQITADASSYQEQLNFVTKYNYQLPEDMMQIISTFKCRSDR